LRPNKPEICWSSRRERGREGVRDEGGVRTGEKRRSSPRPPPTPSEVKVRIKFRRRGMTASKMTPPRFLCNIDLRLESQRCTFLY
jgi:hypothetical protein